MSRYNYAAMCQGQQHNPNSNPKVRAQNNQLCVCDKSSPRNQAISARALRSLWKISKWARIFFPSREGLIINARRPLRSSDWVKTVEAPSLAGSIWNLCKPAMVNTGGPCQENKLSVFSFGVDNLQLTFLCFFFYDRGKALFSPWLQRRTWSSQCWLRFCLLRKVFAGSWCCPWARSPSAIPYAIPGMLRSWETRGAITGQLVSRRIRASKVVHTISRTLAGGAAISIVLVIILTVMWLGGVGCARKGDKQC